jgi:hypothetical protein
MRRSVSSSLVRYLFPSHPIISDFLLTVLTVNYVVQDGKSNWLEGMILMCTLQQCKIHPLENLLTKYVAGLYAILGTLFFFYPGMPTVDHFAVCT